VAHARSVWSFTELGLLREDLRLYTFRSKKEESAHGRSVPTPADLRIRFIYLQTFFVYLTTRGTSFATVPLSILGIVASAGGFISSLSRLCDSTAIDGVFRFTS